MCAIGELEVVQRVTDEQHLIAMNTQLESHRHKLIELRVSRRQPRHRLGERGDARIGITSETSRPVRQATSTLVNGQARVDAVAACDSAWVVVGAHRGWSDGDGW